MKKLKETLKKSYIIPYSILFIIIALYIFFIFNKYDCSFIRAGDGVAQHYVTLFNYRKMLVYFIRSGIFTTFTWNISNGLDLFSNYAFYIIGDPFAYLSILFKTINVDVVYNINALLRVYFIGISFLIYAIYHKINKNPAIIGALIYTFSSFVLVSFSRHPYFINPVIIFPLLMMGIEKIIKDNKTLFFTAVVFFAGINNFYFAYSLFLVIAVYGIFLSIDTYKKEGVKKIIKVLLKTFMFSIIGLMLSAFILLPSAISLINSERVTNTAIFPYTLSYYRNFIGSLISINSPGYWVYLSVQSLIFITLPIFAVKYRKQNKSLLYTMLVLLIPLLVSQVGSMFVGFGYPNNRWSFVYTFFFGFITSYILNQEIKLSKKELLAIISAFIIYFSSNVIFEINISMISQIQILFIFVYLLIFYLINNYAKYQKFFNSLLVLIVTIGILFSAKYLYDVKGNNYVIQHAQNNSMQFLMNTSKNTIPDFANAIEYIKNTDNGFYKIMKNPYNYENVSLLLDYYSIGQYYSIIPKYNGLLNVDLENNDYYLRDGFREFDYRTKITTLLGNKYLINYNQNNIPFGYERIVDYNNQSQIYINNYSLPFGILYTNYISPKEYDSLNAIEKENSLLKNVILDKKNNNLKSENKQLPVKVVDYKLIDKDNLFVNKNSIEINDSSKRTFELNIDDISNSELYISFTNLKHESFNKDEIINLNINEFSTFNDISLINNKYKWYKKNNAYSINVKYNKISKTHSVENYLNADPSLTSINNSFNLGYYDKSSGNIIITLSDIGYYTFDDMKVYSVSFDDYESDINSLRKSNFETIEVKDNYLKGKVNSLENGILQFQTLYDKGWKVYVDDKEVSTLNVNKYFLGIEISKGKHDIYLEYHTPYLKEGIFISLSGIIILILTTKKKLKK